MKLASIIGFAALAGVLLASPASAEDQKALLNSGPAKGMALPDPSHIPIVFGKDIKWKGKAGEMQAPIFGDANKPGIYGVLIKWDPGHNSKPHFHSSDRYIYVVSGTWWVSASNHYDLNKMYPVPAGSFVTDLHNTVHWDGAKASTGPCILMLVGEGPMHTTRLAAPSDGSQNYKIPAGSQGK